MIPRLGRATGWMVLLVVAAATLAGAQQPLLRETFDGATGSRPQAWRAVGATEGDFWLVDDGRLRSGDGDLYELGLNWLVVQTPESADWRNVRIESEFWMERDLGQVALAVRWKDERNHYAAILQTFRRPGLDTIESQIEIRKFADGNETTLAIALSPDTIRLPDFWSMAPDATPRRFAFEASGNNLRAFLDGQQILTATDSAHAAGSVAVGQAFNSVLFDNAAVTQIAGPAAPAPTVVAATPTAAPRATSTPAPIPGLDPSPATTIAFDTAPATTATGTRQYFLILVERANEESFADAILLDLADYTNVKKIRHRDGTFSVELGPFASRADAERVEADMTTQGYWIQGIREEVSTGPVVAAATPTPVPPRPTEAAETPRPTPTPVPEVTVAQRVAQLRAEAEGAEADRNFEQARDYWRSIMTLVTTGPDYEQARSNFERLNELIRTPQQQAAGAGEERSMMMYVLIGVGVLVLVGVIVLVLVLKSRKRDEELRRRVEQLAAQQSSAAPAAARLAGGKSVAPPPAKAAPAAKGTASAKPASGTPAPMGIPGAPPRSPLPGQKKPPSSQGVPKAPEAPAAPSTDPLVEVGAKDRIRPGTMSSAPDNLVVPGFEQPPAPPSQTAQAPTPVAPGPPPKPQHVPAAPSEDDDSLKLDFLFEEEQKKDAAFPDLDLPEEPKREPSTEFIIPPPPDVAPGVAPAAPAPAPAAPAAAPAATNRGVFYEQSFDDEPDGEAPRNWRGQYEYATLSVADGGTNSGKCLRFEKKNGVGSAYYSCKFPNATGRIGVEFDIRCDEKNKYLLGFYIEKDEDFRQSIHTIVHRTNSSASPTLRIQNESTPYEFGKWTHIKFEIDLPRHIIDGYADGKPVAMGVRLNSCPKAINTLSIRDNLATTGVLLIDNIRIYKI